MYTLYSGKNIRVMVDQPTASKTFNVAFYECTDKNGENYKTVIIGTQTWMAENLAYLPYTTSTDTYSLIAPCYYVYDYATYGVLYNWTAALNSCPAGWHLPSDADWQTLSNYLANNDYNYEKIGGNAKSLASTLMWKSYWASGTPGNDPGGNNGSCFSALPGGFFNYGYGFHGAGFDGYWWSSKEHDADNAEVGHLFYSSDSGPYWGDGLKINGFSVRCVKD